LDYILDSAVPESCRLLLLRSSSVRLQDWELRAEDRAAQLLSERLQPLSLDKKKYIINEK